MYMFLNANRIVWNAQFHIDKKQYHLENRFLKKIRPFSYNSEKEAVPSFSKDEYASCLGSKFSKERRLFNYNPEKEEVSFFVTRVLAELFPFDKIKEFEALSSQIEDQVIERKKTQDESKKNEYEERIKDLRNELTEKKQVREKVKFSFKNFDILKNAIPIELVTYTKDVSRNDILVILRNGYLTNQVNALFNLSEAEMELLSKKGKNRKGKEEVIYANVMKLMSKILELIDACQSEEKTYSNNKKKILKDIKKLGSKGKKMYKLLFHLI